MYVGQQLLLGDHQWNTQVMYVGQQLLLGDDQWNTQVMLVSNCFPVTTKKAWLLYFY
jgi:hypothetical protein